MRNLFSLVRITLLFVALTVVQFNAFSAFLKNIPMVVVNPDGTKINCFASGDEYFNYLHDKPGYTIIQAKDGYYYFGVSEGDIVVPSQYRVTEGLPKSGKIRPGAVISSKEYSRRVDAFWAEARKSDSKAPHTGTMNNIVVYISFSDDTELTTPRSTYD